MDYSFLNNLTLVDTGRQRSPKTTNPEGLTVRVFANGDVYPSKDLVEKFALEYVPKQDERPSFGFDIIDSLDWTPFATLPRMILFGVVNKNEAKVDLFGTCRYNEDGTPKSTVLSQGTGNQTLLDLVRSMGYLTEDQKYCDLQIVIDHPINMQDGIANIPKIVERGKDKGQKTYERREGEIFYAVNTVENLATIQQTTVNENITSPVETL